jgi:hypothetical protein
MGGMPGMMGGPSPSMMPGMPMPGMMGMAQDGPPMLGASASGMGVPAVPQQQPTGGKDPVALLAALRELVGVGAEEDGPIYRPGYRRPPKPTPDRIRQQGDQLHNQNQMWRFLIETTLKWIRQELCGIFPEDREARKMGLQEEYVSSALSDERNLFVSKLATLQVTYKKLYLDDNLRQKAQMVEDAVVWLRREEQARHVVGGNRPLALDEAAMFTDYGMIACRHPMFPQDPEFPIQIDLIDPLQVNVVWGRHGPDVVIRKYSDTAERIAWDYGDFAPSVRKKLESKYGKDGWLDPNIDLPVYEYWDTWYRCVLVDDQPLIPVTEHAYGCTPWTIQYGGLGEPMFTRTPMQQIRQGANTEWIVSDGNRADERVNKAVPLCYYGIRRHETYEAVMARLLMAFKKEVNPPWLLIRGLESYGTPLPEVGSGPGQVTELAEDERPQPYPQLAGGPATQEVLKALGIDRATNSAPIAMYGQTDSSQVSGSAMNALTDAGMDKLAPHVLAYTSYLQTKADNILYLLKNHGDDAKYGGPSVRPLMVPKRRARNGEAPAFELGKELLEEVGTRIEVKLSRINPRDWPTLVNAGKLAVEAGFITPDVISEMMGVGDYDRMFEDWLEHQGVLQAFQHPKFAEMFTIPMTIQEQIEQSAGDPMLQQRWQKLLEGWFQTVAMQPQPAPGGGPQGSAPGAQGPAQQGGAPPPSGNPPTAAGVSYPETGQGPGSQGAAVGRPGFQGGYQGGQDVGP